MKNLCPLLVLCVAALSSLAQSTAFTYQGRLTEAGSPTSGTFDFIFTLYRENDVQLGIHTNTEVRVADGTFLVVLDFGGAAFDGGERRLEIAVRPSGSPAAFVTLSPRQRIHATPYAVHAASAGSASNLLGSVTDEQLPENIARLNAPTQAFGGQVVFTNAENTFAGWFSGDGSGVTNIYGLRVIPNTKTPNLVGGWSSNTVGSAFYSYGNVIAGGGGYDPFSGTDNQNSIAFGAFNVIGGGAANTVSGFYSSIGGGFANTNVGDWNSLGGGRANVITAQQEATISGGSHNIASNFSATVGGGGYNVAGGSASTVAGGNNNQAVGHNSSVSGGAQNLATGYGATVGGGTANQASGYYATVSGGSYNVASNWNATVPGGEGNVAGGRHSFAAGRDAKALHDNTFVWSDGIDAAFASTGPNQFLIRSAAVGINKTNPSVALDVSGTIRGNSVVGFFHGDGYSISNLNASSMTGVLPDGVLGSNVARLNSANSFQYPIFAPEFRGSGEYLTNLSADEIRLGVLRDSMLSPNIARYSDGVVKSNTHAVFTTVSAQHIAGTFVGNGGPLTNLFGGHIVGQINVKSLPVGTTSNEVASGVHTHNASDIDSGVLPDERLSSNVPRLNPAHQVFTGVGQFNGGLRVSLNREIVNNEGSWLASYSTGGWVNVTFGGGWYMSDTNSVRSYNGRTVYTSGDMQAGGQVQAPTGRFINGIRTGSESGTSEGPDPANVGYRGTIVRRIVSTNPSTNQVIARTDYLTLERDGTFGGFLIRWPVSVGRQTIACQAITATGASVNFYLATNILYAGTVHILNDAQNVVSFQCTFGNTYTAGHTTQVNVSRYTGDNYWVGTVTSSFTQ